MNEITYERYFYYDVLRNKIFYLITKRYDLDKKYLVLFRKKYALLSVDE